MGKKKTEQKQQQSYQNVNTYGYLQAPETADVQALRNFQFTADPSAGYAFGSAKNQLANSFNNPIGGVYSPQMRDAILRSGLSDLAMKESQAKAEAHQGLQGARYGQRVALASMTAPRLVQTGASGSSAGTGTTVQSGGLLESLLAGGVSGASAGVGGKFR